MSFPLNPPVMIIAGARTPWGKFTGSLSEYTATDLAVMASKEAIKRSGVPTEKFGHTVMAVTRATSSLDAHHSGRHVGLKAGLPVEAGGFMLNRLCGGSLQSTVSGAYIVALGEADYVLVGGSESSRIVLIQSGNFDSGSDSERARCTTRSGTGLWTHIAGSVWAEPPKSSRRNSGSRARRRICSRFEARLSQRRLRRTAGLKRKSCRSSTRSSAEKNAGGRRNPRATTLEQLAKLRPAYVKDGQVTAGNACGLADGAGALVIGSAKAVERDGIEPLGELLAWSAVGVPPDIMGIGPSPAITKDYQTRRAEASRYRSFEINEAFACQVLSVLKDLGLEQERVNVQGGSVSLGHPLGASGARLTLSLLLQMQRNNVKYGIAAMCIGGGQGMAAVFRNPLV